MVKALKFLGTSFRGVTMIAALLSVLSFGNSAHAQTYQDPCADGKINTQFQNAFGQVGNIKTSAAHQILGMFGAIDVKAQYCWANIQRAFQMLSSMQGKSLNPFSWMVTIIVGEIASIILQFINNACGAVIQTLNGLRSYLMSQLNRMCIPVPDLSLGLGRISLGSFANSGPCNGISPLSFGYQGQLMSPGNFRAW